MCVRGVFALLPIINLKSVSLRPGTMNWQPQPSNGQMSVSSNMIQRDICDASQWVRISLLSTVKHLSATTDSHHGYKAGSTRSAYTIGAMVFPTQQDITRK